MGMVNLENLRTVLYSRTADALENYQRVCKAEPDADWELDRRSFVALFNVIEEAGLEDDYYAWKEAVGR